MPETGPPILTFQSRLIISRMRAGWRRYWRAWDWTKSATGAWGSGRLLSIGVSRQDGRFSAGSVLVRPARLGFSLTDSLSEMAEISLFITHT